MQDCFSDTIFAGEDKTSKFSVSDMKTSGKMADSEWETNTVGVQFGNGVTGIMAYNPYCNANPHDANSNVMDCIALLYDVSGFQKPNALSKDVRATSNVNVSAMGNLCLAKVAGVCVTRTAFIPSPVTRDECLKMAQSGKYGNIPTCDSDYGSNLYWTGAVKACGGVSNLPTDSQMKDIIKAVYDCGDNCTFKWNAINAGNYNYGEFSKLSGGLRDIDLWITSGTVYKFHPTSYYPIWGGASSYAICVGE